MVNRGKPTSKLGRRGFRKRTPTVTKMRRMAAASAGRNTSGRCLTTTLALEYSHGNDPAVNIRKRQVEAWVALWKDLKKEEEETVQKAWLRRLVEMSKQAQPWRSVKGPMGATDDGDPGARMETYIASGVATTETRRPRGPEA